MVIQALTREGQKLYGDLLIDATAQTTEHPMIRRAVEERWLWTWRQPLPADMARRSRQWPSRAARSIASMAHWFKLFPTDCALISARL